MRVILLFSLRCVTSSSSSLRKKVRYPHCSLMASSAKSVAFSQKLGLVDADDLSGEPIYLSIENLETLPAPVQDEATAKKLVRVDRGVFYNVPARMKATVFTSGQKYAEIETPMGQFGSVQLLSNLLFDKKTTTKVTFFQQTGGTKDIKE